MKRLFYWILTIASLLVSCRQNGSVSNDLTYGIPIELRYSKLLRLYDVDTYTIAEVLNPADTAVVSRRYILINNDAKTDGIPDGTIIKVPIQNALICTSLHAGLFKTLGATDQIGGVCDAKYMVDSMLTSMIKDKKITDCGLTANPDREKIVTIAPDAVLMSPYDGVQASSFFSDANIPVVDCIDYIENTPLGQAEWIKFYGILTGRKNVSDSIFDIVERNYNDLKMKITLSSYRPMLLTEKMYQQTWFVPTGRSTSGEFYRAAGFYYIFNDEKAAGGRVSVPLTFEQVFAKAHEADIWIFKYYGENQVLTLDKLAQENPNYKDFKAFRTGNVFACNTFMSPYYDETPFRPDILLRELVSISHPDLQKDYKPKYFFRLEQCEK